MTHSLLLHRLADIRLWGVGFLALALSGFAGGVCEGYHADSASQLFGHSASLQISPQLGPRQS